MELRIGKPPFTGYRWAAKGDINAFFALMLDNMLNLVVLTAILAGVGFPTEYVYKLMIPGTALGVLYLPWQAPAPATYYFVAGYLALAAVLLALSFLERRTETSPA